ncbi:MAG: di-heme-cytochrome C peroxidase [Gammaproteobacteria bacterium]
MKTVSKHSQLAIFSGLLLSISGCTSWQTGPQIQEGSRVADATDSHDRPIVNLEQGWTTDTQQAFYFTDQGSRIMPYQWFLALEQADNEHLFRSDANINGYRYIPAEASPLNPDALPVGFAKHTDTANQQAWVGMTCAACHTAQISYQNVEIRLDGGPTLADFETFNVDLVRAMAATYEDQAKFNRFALRVLGKTATPNQINALRQDLLQQTLVLEKRNHVNRPSQTQPQYGYARVDAIGAIFNQILAKFNGLPTAGFASTAPVSYPFLWGTHQSNVVQWPGFAPNGPASAGALIRNGGEVLGVYGQLHVPSDASIKHYRSSLNISNLGKLESWIAELRSPEWPAQYFPAIDPVAAAKGSVHFDQYCASCHQVIARENEGQSYNAVLTPLKEVKTDPTELKNMIRQRPAGKFEGRKEFVLAGPVIEAQTSGLEPLVNAVVGALLEHPEESLEASLIDIDSHHSTHSNGTMSSDSAAAMPDELAAALKDFGDQYENSKTKTVMNTMADATDPLVYKGRPLNGIWATAPYLHNGSVPNLYEILLPATERSKTFYLGSREYDPIKVGFNSDASSTLPNAFKFDTSRLGNSNSGHEYGVHELNKTEKQELLEYMKTL